MKNNSYNSWLTTIYSDGSSMFLSNPNPRIGDNIQIKIRIIKTSPVQRIYLRRLVNGEETLVQMEEEKQRKYSIYSANIEVNQPVINYHFIILTENRIYFYNQLGIFQYNINEDYDFKIVADFNKPTWIDNSIFYQIFVDRFFNGDTNNDVKDFEYEQYGFSSKAIPWNERPGKYEEYGNLNFYGGDLKGIENKIEYLKELGINALYLNPVFSSPSNHKYDCENFFEVDKHFGGNKDLKELVEKLHENDIKVILDISINHTGITNKWTEKNPEFYYENSKGEFECWNGIKTLPVLNYTNKAVQYIMYKGENSVLKYWMKEPYNIDGWRLDVGHNVGKMDNVQMYKDIWRDVKKSVKDENKDSYIVAEHWTDCSEYLQGDMWDGTMNYFGFMRPLRRYLGESDKFLNWKIDNLKMKTNNGEIFKEEVTRHYGKLPYQLQNLQLNLLSSHDLHRIHTSPVIDRKNIKTAIIMLFTFIGTPCIYYGDEVMLDGNSLDDQGCRYPMEWNKECYDKEINQLYKKMIHIRKNESILKNGSFKFLKCSGNKVVYCRFDEKEAIIFINSQEKRKSFISIPLDCIGEVNSVRTLYGDNFKYEISENILNCFVDTKETILIKADFIG
ncbi:MAG: glycoside hydrolase family 13 protein [Clostridium beijerinckii]|jgi:alpha-glucosidase|nr:glycoside hydrolase family 13 protein [Clostridium beijerinckii]MCI1578259.1 glycoside hydrolase family 13 protein [Clostridium beijerinckii]MCI1583817.1 glycoside hydrolase family 13 protein [Clostridium beijerinckii]MCI1621458.1 glycoside hydrolase family 13 protein [Clostridium beijerinckii]